MKNLSQYQEWLKGTIERVTFHSEESGFCVLRVTVSYQRDLVTVLGNAANVRAGEFIECSGFWVNDKQHGLQFKATHLKTITPTTLEGIEKYLSSGMIRGIGPGYAKRLVRIFKELVFTVIEKTPERLHEVEGIGQKRREQIVKAWAEQKVVRDIMVFLHAHGVGTARSVRIYKTYGNDAINKITQNPYQLAHDIHGIGFKTADQLAMCLGFAKDAPIRLSAGVTYCLQDYTTNGHCGCEKATLVKNAALMLEVSDENLILEAIETQKKEQRITEILRHNLSCCFLTSLHLAEKGIAQHITRLLKGHPPWSGINVGKALDWVQKKTGLLLSNSQQKAIELALKSKVMIITGGPGVGKTTLVNSIIKIIQIKTAEVLLGAPTGRAAKRLSESTGLNAKTLHRLLEFDPSTFKFKRNQNLPLSADLVILDESSMIDVPLMNQLLQAIPDEAVLLLVGDIDQLPSVGPGNVLKDLIESQLIPTARLTEIFRQAATSHIITNAHRINKGEFPLGGNKETQSDFYWINCEDPELIKEKILTLIKSRIPQKFQVDPICDVQVLTPTKRGGLGSLSLNLELQKQLNPQKDVITKFGMTYGIGDKVIQIVNNYDKDVFNGDIGKIIKIDMQETLLWINFDERCIEYDFSDLDEINLAYATTIHKSQGSEYPVVVIPLTNQHYTLLERNLLYTGVTRGKKLVVLVGQKKALVMAIKRIGAQKRLTYLKELLNTDY